MRCLMFFVSLMSSWVVAQNSRRPSSEHNGHGWDIRLAVPGEPGSDYPTLGNIPRTHFSCAGKEPGYYADVEAGCQVFRVCTVGSTYGFQSFLCPNGTLFNQDVFVCDWWMNVKCRPAERLTASNFDQFGNLRLGPQLMKDIKKMLTHTMRNPYDENAMKGNLIVMQNYRPPVGQLFPNGALIAGPERAPSNVYVPAKQIQQPNYNPSYTFSDSSYAASTPDTKYIPTGFTSQVQNSDAEVFQRQREQSAQYVQNNRIQATPNTVINSIPNGRTQEFTQQTSRLTSGQQPTHNYNQAQYIQRNNAGNTFTTNAYNNQRGQSNSRHAQYTDIRKPTQLNSGKQNEIVPYAKQQYEDKQPYTYRQPNPTLSTEQDVSKELKQNLALVFSFLADSLNAAKKYNNIVKQDVIAPTPTQTPQTQNFNNEDLSHIANKVSELTSSQYSNNNNQPPNTAARIQTTTRTSQSNQFTGNAKYTNNDRNAAQPIQSAQYNIVPSLQTQAQLYSLPYQTDHNLNANLLDSNQNAIYSGQLYQLPVPEVTSQIYNRPQSGNLVQTTLQHQKQITNSPPATNQNNNLPNHNNLIKQSSAEVEIVQSKTLPLTPAKLQSAPSNDPESFYSQESLNSLLNSDNGISAQLQDKIVGIIPHPLEDDKLVSYEKDQSYYLYTKLDNNGPGVLSATVANNIAGRQNTKLTRGNHIPNVITFQFVPSVSYQLEDEKEQQKLLNTFQIDEFGAPRDAVKGNLVQDTNQQRATMVSNVDFTVEHPSSRQTLNSVSALYKGPSSYSAPQGSVGNLLRQTLLPNFSSRLEQLDSKSNNDGYPRTAPARRFAF